MNRSTEFDSVSIRSNGINATSNRNEEDLEQECYLKTWQLESGGGREPPFSSAPFWRIRHPLRSGVVSFRCCRPRRFPSWWPLAAAAAPRPLLFPPSRPFRRAAWRRATTSGGSSSGTRDPLPGTRILDLLLSHKRNNNNKFAIRFRYGHVFLTNNINKTSNIHRIQMVAVRLNSLMIKESINHWIASIIERQSGEFIT